MISLNNLHRCPDGLWRAPILQAQPWLGHAFGTASTNPPGELLELQQIHSACVFECSEWHAELEGDGLIVDRPGAAIAVKSADCLPILLADPVNRIAAAVHAGWRGTLAELAARAVEKMTAVSGCRAGNIIAAFGPSIRLCCFEVGPEVALKFRPWFPEWDDLDRHAHIDLPEVNRRQLLSAGLLAERIAAGAPCTVCHPHSAGVQEFHSWRRDHKTGARMRSAIWLL